MFLISASRSDLADTPAFAQTRSLPVTDLRLRVGWTGDDFLWRDGPQGWTLWQGIRGADGPVPGTMRVEIAFVRQGQTLTVRISPVVGVPVYYAETPSGDLFIGSCVRLLREAGVPIAENTAALPEFLAYRCLLAPDTLFRDIKRVPHGGELTCRVAGGRPDLRLTALADRLRGVAPTENDLDGHALALTERLTRALHPLAGIRDRVAMLLSGGLDSSILCRLAERDLGRRDTVSTGYPFENADVDVERRYALSAAAAMGFSHRYIETTTPRYLAGVVEAIALAESPVHHLQSVCLHLLLKDGIGPAQDVILQGLGAGGVVGNFRNFLFLRDKPWARALASTPVYRLLGLLPPLTGRGRTLLGKLRDLRNAAPLDDPGNPIWAWHQYGDVDWICAQFGVTPLDVAARHMERVRGLQAGSLYDAWALYSLLADEEATLAVWARLAAANRRVFHFPFYDEEFLRYALSIPWPLKLGRTENGLRKTMARHLGVPGFVRNRRKAGFGVRRDDWALEGGVFDPLARLAADVVGEKELRGLRCREPRKAMLFWNLVNYALWKRLCLGGESPQDLSAAAGAPAQTPGRGA